MKNYWFKTFTVASALVIQLVSSTLLNVRAGEHYDYSNEATKLEVINLSSTISEADVERIKESVNAKIVLEDNAELPVDTVITIEDASVNNHIAEISESDAKSYKISILASVDTEKLIDNRSQTKYVSDNSTMNNGSVNATAFLIMRWTDGPGLDNYIDEVECSRSVYSGTVTSATLRYGNGYQSAFTWTSVNVTSYASHTVYPNMAASKPAADYSIRFQEASIDLYVDVAASIFQ